MNLNDLNKLNELKEEIEEIKIKVEVLNGMVKSLWRDGHPLDSLEVVK